VTAASYVGPPENLVIETKANNLLLAFYLFEKYIVSLEQGKIGEFARKIVVQITSLINPSISSQPYKEILNHYILLFELFFDEMLFISQLSLVLDRKQRTSLENAILTNFESSSVLLNSEQLSHLFVIPTFKTKEDVQQSIAYSVFSLPDFPFEGSRWTGPNPLLWIQGLPVRAQMD
jgi:hypothetical protein